MQITGVMNQTTQTFEFDMELLVRDMDEQGASSCNFQIVWIRRPFYFILNIKFNKKLGI